MNVFFRNIHLYLSLASGIVIAIVCFTGAMLVFEKEMVMSIYPERYRVEVGSQPVSIDQMINGLQEKVPGAAVSSVKIYDDPTRTVELSYRDGKEAGAKGERHGKADRPAGRSEAAPEKKADAGANPQRGEKKEGAKGGPGPRGPGNQAFINPYTGQVAGLQSQRHPFFFTMFSLHRWLLMGDTGKLIVGISTSLFLFILITGIVLWWPQNKKILKQRLILKWNAGWKRINHDLHIVVGFYTAVFLFVFAFTGLAWSFQWFNDAIYWVTGTENVRPEPPKSTLQEGANTLSFDQVYAAVRQQVPEAEFYAINRPREEDGAYSVTIMRKDAAHERDSDQLFFDQYSGNLIGKSLFAERNLGQRVRATFYPVHVGSIAGLPGRIIAFIACIAGFTFPITGVILWINRLKKKKKKSRKNAFTGTAKSYSR